MQIETVIHVYTSCFTSFPRAATRPPPPLSSRTAPCVAAFIKNSPWLTAVNFGNNDFHGSCPLPRTGSPQMLELILDHNTMTDRAVPCITNFLRHSPLLSSVLLFHQYRGRENRFSGGARARMKAALPKYVIGYQGRGPF